MVRLKHIIDAKFFTILVLFFVSNLMATEKSRIAVMPFLGDKTVTPEQLDFITGKFTSELINSKRFTVLDRKNIDVILKEQGFQQSGVCNSSECQVEIGQMLGVDFLVNGNMVRFGPEYAFRIEYVDVSTGEVSATVEISKKGELHEVYRPASRELAQRLAQKVSADSDASNDSKPLSNSELYEVEGSEPENVDAGVTGSDSKGLSLKRKIALGLLAPALGGGGAGVYFNNEGVSALEDYDQAVADGDFDAANTAWDEQDNAKNMRNISYSVSAFSLVTGIVLWFWPE